MKRPVELYDHDKAKKGALSNGPVTIRALASPFKVFPAHSVSSLIKLIQTIAKLNRGTIHCTLRV
jgi:hypothetical protein